MSGFGKSRQSYVANLVVALVARRHQGEDLLGGADPPGRFLVLVDCPDHPRPLARWLLHTVADDVVEGQVPLPESWGRPQPASDGACALVDKCVPSPATRPQ